MRIIFIFLMNICICVTLHAQSTDEASVQQSVTLAFDALSNRDSNALKLQCLPGVKFYEHGKIWTLDSLINRAVTQSTGADFKRTNKIEFESTTIKGDVAWTTYHLYSEFHSNGKNRTVHWLETQILVKEENKWKIKVLHSTNVQ